MAIFADYKPIYYEKYENPMRFPVKIPLIQEGA